ncbi:MAG: hypothetical protein JRH17_23325 [Deltaproteobacteria bacterium]|nr:hypothetical protein [Deltaproteobacteria bacterium]
MTRASNLIGLVLGLALILTFACNEGNSAGSSEICEMDCQGFCEAMAECPLALEGDCMSQCDALVTDAERDTGGDSCVDALCKTLSCIEGLECDGLFVTIEEGTLSILGGCYDRIDVITNTCEELIGNRPPDKPDDDPPPCPDC